MTDVWKKIQRQIHDHTQIPDRCYLGDLHPAEGNRWVVELLQTACGSTAQKLWLWRIQAQTIDWLGATRPSREEDMLEDARRKTQMYLVCWIRTSANRRHRYNNMLYPMCAPNTKFLSLNGSEAIKGVPKFQNWSRDLSHAPLRVKFSSANKGLHALY